MRASLLSAVLLAANLFQPLPAEQVLSLEACILQALKANRVLRSRAYDREIALLEIEAEEADRRPSLVASGRLEGNERRNSVEEEVSQGTSIFDERNELYNVALETPLISGGEVRLGIQASELSNNLTSSTLQDPFEPQYSSFVGISLNQPLLRDAGRIGSRSLIALARVRAGQAEESLRRQRMATAALAESAFWDLLLAQREVAERRRSVEISQELLEDNRERVGLGKMAELEVFQAEAGVALRRTRLYQAEQNMSRAQNQLASILAQPADEDPLVVDGELEVESELPPLQEAVTQALALHPDYRVQKKVIEEEGVRLQFARNQNYPEIDLIASYGYNGLGETYGDSFDDLSDSEFDSWSVGVTLRIPLGGSPEAKRLEAAQARRKQAINDLKGIEIEVVNGIRTVYDKVSSSRSVIGDFQTVVDYNLRVLNSEQTALEEGKSNSRRVLQVEEDLTDSRIAALEAAVDHVKTLIELRLADGSLLSHRGLEASEVEPLP